MPQANAGWRVRIRALPSPGYRFIGWNGDVAGSRNPITLIMNRPYAVQAQFARALVAPSAVLSATAYFSPGACVVHGQFNYETGRQLRELRWRPNLPAGWKPVGVSGLAGPELDAGQVRFTGRLGHNPILFNLSLEVPPGEAGPRPLGGVVEYGFVGEDGLFTQPVGSLSGRGDLVVNARPSPAARLGVSRSGGRLAIRIHGDVGRTYTLEQVSDFSPRFERFWWFFADVTLTNSPQTWVDETFTSELNSGMYHAVLIE